jgi:hypothetical protein
MRLIFSVSILAATAALFVSCKKEDKADGCFPGAATVREITNRPAVIKVTATVNPVYLVEQGSIDTKLIPCNLPKEFIEHDLQVIVSGQVKETKQGDGPCCSENFIITKITK